MFDNPDFEGAPKYLMIPVIISTYEALHDYSRVLGLSWIDTSINFKGGYSSPSLNPESSNIELAIIFLIPMLFISIKNCIKRVRANKISIKQAVFAYFKSLCEYGICLLLMIIFVPIITPYLRGWKSIF